MKNIRVNYSIDSKHEHFDDLRDHAFMSYKIIIDRLFETEFGSSDNGLSFCECCNTLVWGFDVFADEDKLRQRVKEVEAFLPGTKFLVKERAAINILEVIDHETEKLRSIGRGERSPTTGRPLPYLAPVTDSYILNSIRGYESVTIERSDGKETTYINGEIVSVSFNGVEHSFKTNKLPYIAHNAKITNVTVGKFARDKDSQIILNEFQFKEHGNNETLNIR